MWNTPIQSAVLPQLASSVPGSAASAALAAAQASAQQAPKVSPVQQAALGTPVASERKRETPREQKPKQDADTVELESAAPEQLTTYDQTKVLRGTMDYLRKVIDPDIVDGEFIKADAKETMPARDIDSEDFTPIESVDDLKPKAVAPSQDRAGEPGARLDVEA